MARRSLYRVAPRRGARRGPAAARVGGGRATAPAGEHGSRRRLHHARPRARAAASAADYPANSWSTGTNTTVNSHYTRLLALNPAISGPGLERLRQRCAHGRSQRPDAGRRRAAA